MACSAPPPEFKKLEAHFRYNVLKILLSVGKFITKMIARLST